MVDMACTFTGENEHTLDTKGRLIVPAKLREDLGESFMITMGFDGCLCAYPNDEWELFVAKLRSLPELRKEARTTLRHFVARAARCELDKQGRILIPAKLREFAALEKEIVFVGALSKVEIWSKERWDENDILDMQDIADQLSDLGIDF